MHVSITCIEELPRLPNCLMNNSSASSLDKSSNLVMTRGSVEKRSRGLCVDFYLSRSRFVLIWTFFPKMFSELHFRPLRFSYSIILKIVIEDCNIEHFLTLLHRAPLFFFLNMIVSHNVSISCPDQCWAAYSSLAWSPCVLPGTTPQGTLPSYNDSLSYLTNFWTSLTPAQVRCLCNPWYAFVRFKKMKSHIRGHLTLSSISHQVWLLPLDGLQRLHSILV